MPTGKGTDQEYLLNEQYKDASNLRARIHLHRQYSVNTYGWTRWVFDYVKLSPDDAHILELGCGPCDLWLQNLDRIPDGWEIFLSDLSPGMIEKGQDLLFDRAQRFTFQEFDAQEIPHDDSSLDTVIANHMLYHVPDLEKSLGEIKRVLKPTGRLFAATNGSGHMQGMRLLREKFITSIGSQTSNNTELDATDTSNGGQEAGEGSEANSKEPQAHKATASKDKRKKSGKNKKSKNKTGDKSDHENTGPEQWGLAFNLENGEELLRAYFPQVSLRRYVDSLQVRSARALHDYMMSSRVHSVSPELRSDFYEFLQAEMEAAGGTITIEKETGMFQAWEEDLPLPEAKHVFSFIEDDPNVELAVAPLQINLGDDEDEDDDDDDDSTKVQNLQLEDK